MGDHQPALHELMQRRAFLLQSLEDLDHERSAGDLTDADYQLLRDDYTRRAAEVLRAIDAQLAERPGPASASDASGAPHRSPSASESSQQPSTGWSCDAAAEASTGDTTGASPRGGPTRDVSASPRWLKSAAITLAVLLVAGGLGVFVADQAGERTASDGLTGTVNTAVAGAPDARVQTLLETGRQKLGNDNLGALRAFDEAAQLDPTRAEAFAYAGWILRIVSLSAADPAQKRELQTGALARLNAALEANPQYPDAYAFRGIMQLRDLDDPMSALGDFVTLSALDAPEEITAMVTAPRLEAERKVAAARGTTAPETE